MSSGNAPFHLFRGQTFYLVIVVESVEINNDDGGKASGSNGPSFGRRAYSMAAVAVPHFVC